MRPRSSRVLAALGALSLLLVPRTSFGQCVNSTPPASPGLMVCASQTALSHSATLTSAYNAILTAWSGGNHRLLNVLSNHAAPPSTMCNLDTFAPTAEPAPSTDAARAPRAYNHLVLVGLPPNVTASTTYANLLDPMSKWTWQREARGEYAATTSGLYVFGFGHLVGDIGYVESDRNPFLHGQDMCDAPPFETEVITISGSTPAGVALAAEAFVNDYLVNGVVVAGTSYTRGPATLLDRNPTAAFVSTLPTTVTVSGDAFTLLGITEGAEDEYRGVLADTLAATSNVVPYEPLQIVRGKYHETSSVWTESNLGCASTSFECKVLDQYATGLHRRAYGNTIWAAQYKNAADAKSAAAAIAGAAGLPHSGAMPWVGTQPLYESGVAGAPSQNALALWTSTATNGAWVYMTTMPAPSTWVSTLTWP